MCGHAPRQLGRALPQALDDWTRTSRRDEGQRVPADRFKACTFENRHSTAVSSPAARREGKAAGDAPTRSTVTIHGWRVSPRLDPLVARPSSRTCARCGRQFKDLDQRLRRGQPASTARSLRGSQRQSGRPGPRCTPPSQRSVAGRVERPAITSTPADVMAYLPSANRLTSGARSSATAHSGRSLIHGGRSLTKTATNNSLADRGANRNTARISRSSRDTPLRASGSSASSRLNAGTPAHGRGSGERRAAKASGRGSNRRRRRHAVYRLRSARCGTETSHTGAE
jgi:hypothetical protein